MRFNYLWFCLILLASCAPKKDTQRARDASQARQWDQAYRLWQEIHLQEPDNTNAKLQMERARMNAALVHLQKAGYYFEKGQMAEAEFEVNIVLSYNPENQEATRLLSAIVQRRQAEAESQTPAEEEAPVSTVPTLSPKTMGPLNLYFPKPTSVRDIYRSIGQAYEVNIIVDTKIRDEKTSLDLRNLNFLKALDTLMVLNRHFFKVVDHNTIIILEDSKQNRDRYDNQIIQTFYLSNITPQDLKTHLRQLGGIKEFAENEKLNAITIKGTPQQVALAEKIITANDKAQPEVVVEIELLEVSKNTLRRIGIQPVGPDGSPLYRAGVLADPVSRSDDDRDQNGIRGLFPSLNDNDLLTLLPAVAIDFLRETGDSKQVANPHLRVTSGESGIVRIGQSIPVANTSFTNAQLSGSASGVNNFGDQALTTFNYNDVGIKINVTPRVHYNNEITLVLELEVSSVLSAGFQPILGKREVSTSLRLKNGETNVLAGLLTNDERQSLTGFPGLSRIPLLGKLFSNDEKIVNQTDIIMTIRPIIIRGPNITLADREPHEISSLRLSTLYGDTPLTQVGDWSWDSGQAATARVETPANRVFDPNLPPEASETDLDMIGVPESTEDTPEETPPPPAMLAFTPNFLEIRQDDVLEFQLFIANVEDLNRGELAVGFDPQILEAEGVEIGNFFNAQGGRPLLTPAWDNQQGRLSMVITHRRTGGPFSGSGILAVLRFRAKTPGSGTLVFETLRLLTADRQAIPADSLPATYEVLP